jgi:hypothetical protein
MSDMTPEEFWSILHVAPESTPVFYRLYYNDIGAPIIYSMENIPGNYIDVAPDVYASAPFNVKVVNNQLIHITPPITVKKLQPSKLKGTACSPCDVCIVVNSEQEHIKWNLVNNEID